MINKGSGMTSLIGPQIDFFVSRRGSAAAVAQEVANILKEEGYTAFVQDHDIAYGADFIAAMHNALKQCRHMIVLLTEDYVSSEFTMMEVTNFLAAAGQAAYERRLAILRLDESRPEGILASRVYGDLVDITEPQERRRRILAAAEGRSTATQRRPKIFENVVPRDLNFMGRDQALLELHRLLTGSNTEVAVNSAAIHGLGGTGKSALAAEYAHRYAAEYSGVWWAAAEQRALLISSLATLAGKVDPRLANEPDQHKAAKDGLTRLMEFTTPFLLVYDNVENPESIRDLVPVGARVLITTRWTDWAGRANDVKLDLLGEDEAAQFLQTRAGRTDAPGAARLATALGRLPLALDHAGAYCRLAGGSMTFDAYRDKIDARIARAPRGYPESVARTFSLAIEKATAEHPHAETLLGMFAFLAPERIPLDLITEDILGEEDRVEALIALSAVSLVEHQTLDDGSPAISLHRLVQSAMRSQLALQDKTKSIFETILHAVAAAVPEGAYDEPRHWPRCAQLLPHVLAVHEHAAAAPGSGDLALLYDRAGEFLYARGSLELSRIFFSRAIAAGNNAFGPRHVAVAKAMNNLAVASQDIGRNAESEPLLREALDIQLEKSGIDHPGYARTLTSLARVVQEGGRRDEAEAMLREAIALGERTLGRPHPDVALRINNLAMLLDGKGQKAEAEELFREAIQSGDRSLGREHPQVVARLSNLALCLHGDGKVGEAETLYREAIAGGEKVFGPEHPHLAVCLQNLANLLRDTGRMTEAEPLYGRALSVFVQNFGEDHIHTARVRSNFAKLLIAVGRPGDAQDLAKAALIVHAKALGHDHAWTRDSRSILEEAAQALQFRPLATGAPA
jgi:tetratricopeptide (TPR) repeat protein